MNCNIYIYDKKIKMERQCKFKIKQNSNNNLDNLHIYCNKHQMINVKNRTENLINLKSMMMPFFINNHLINHISRISLILLIEKLFPCYINYIDTYENAIYIYTKYINTKNEMLDLINNSNVNNDINNIIYFIVSLCIAYKFYESEDTDFKENRTSKFYFNYNKYFANYCKIDVKMFNQYEIELLKMIDYKVYRIQHL